MDNASLGKDAEHYMVPGRVAPPAQRLQRATAHALAPVVNSPIPGRTHTHTSKSADPQQRSSLLAIELKGLAAPGQALKN